ncbi:hypothetical protein [Nitrosomonas aestuarii]|nr:hypothetical protein [Nitrosomonas aestuarii]
MSDFRHNLVHVLKRHIRNNKGMGIIMPTTVKRIQNNSQSASVIE